MNVFELFASLTLDSSGYDKGLGEAKEKAEGFGAKLSSGLAVAGKAAGVAITAAAGAAATLTKTAVDGYADYEQLVGGVETLFKESAGAVQEYAAQAYKTAGLSANEYMETVTSFSASLLQSLGGDTDRAASVADQAITDMSDNANKMGTSMEAIQNAYQGFAKQNFTMLDNLKLGYGGTKEEMQRLLEDAQKISGIKFDLSSFADITEAIHVVQTELGITGTTAAEASETISGSAASVKSAWQNLVVGIADENANLGQLITQFVDSASSAAENLLPRISQALNGIGKLVEGMAPVISGVLPKLINDVLPGLMEAASSMVSSLADSIIMNLPSIMATGVHIILTLANGIAEKTPELIPTIVDVVFQIVDTLTDPDTLSGLVEAALAIIIAIAEGLVKALPKLIEAVPKIIANLVTAFATNAPKMFEAALKLIIALAGGLIRSIPELIAAIPQIISAIVQGFAAYVSEFFGIGKRIVEGVWDGIQSLASWLTDRVKGFFSGIVNGVKSLLGIASPSKVFSNIGENMAAGIGKGWDGAFRGIKRDINGDLDFGTRTIDIKRNVAGTDKWFGSYDGAGQTRQPIRIEFTGDLAQLARILQPKIVEESDRRGSSYVTA